ncbi:MAG: transposase [Chloroflexi bacterium]|nr:transposase [Chloroflexota bacterium]
MVKYLGGYMKRVAISNSRLERIKEGKVVFRYKDNRDDGKQKRCRIDGEEFIGRFLRHILPEGFTLAPAASTGVRVRYYGI